MKADLNMELKDELLYYRGRVKNAARQSWSRSRSR
jgi:hypothetical protein